MIHGAGLRSAVTRAAAAAVLLATSFAFGSPTFGGTLTATAAAPAFGHAVVVQHDGEPVLEVDGKPFFFWGAAFFYERIPASQWRSSMLELRRLGANTLDLYVPWNWHEVADGDFDFDGRTNPRRNLRAVIRLGRELGFHFLVRPGPVVRNEWRNGGYPAWLLQRPEYGMPQHDVLEGRYPATATLQNAQSDDAAAEWMRNPTHVRYASRWLHRALAEFRPVADRVLAVQLDDDQGAYIDNQTYPAPHLQAYLRWLEAQARDVVGPATPAFINTYEMRVPASSPVWTMGNWYQSDAYSIGDHDRVALDLATAMLRTNRRGPLAVSEFQAGWLASPEDPQPREADATNTTLALYELLALGVRGVVDFPMQDTLAPFGWEAPFSNALYAWDAALQYPWQPEHTTSGRPGWASPALVGSRYGATWRAGQTLRRFGPLIAESRRLADVALVYPGSAYPGDPALGSAALTRFREHLRECTERGTVCDVVDLAATSAGELRRYRVLVVDDEATLRIHAALLRRYRQRGAVASVVPARDWPGTIVRGPDGTFLIAVNWTNDAKFYNHQRTIDFDGTGFDIPPFDLPARSGRLVVLDVRAARLDPRFPADARLSTNCEVNADDRGITLLTGRGTGCTLVLRTARGRSTHTLAAFRNVRLGIDGTLKDRYTLADISREPQHVVIVGGGRDNVGLSRTTHVTLAGMHPPSSSAPETYRADAFADGSNAVVLQNAVARVVIVPDGGARVPVFALLPTGDRHDPDIEENVFDATGALRDDVLVQQPASPTDRIAKYTHSYPAGTFNRSYAVADAHGGSVRLSATVPDISPAGATFERTVTLAPDAARLVVDERVQFAPGAGAADQRGVVLSALRIQTSSYGRDSMLMDEGGGVPSGPLHAAGGVVLAGQAYGGAAFTALAVSWRPGDVESSSWELHRSNGTLRLVLAPGLRRVTYSIARLPSFDAALRFAEAERAWVGANPAPGR